MPKRKQPPRTPEQDRAAFIDAARELDCDESPEAFIETIRKMASTPPTSNEEVKRKAKKKPAAE